MSAKSTEKETTNKKAAKAAEKEQTAQEAAEKTEQAVETETKTTGQKTEKAAKTAKAVKAATVKEEQKTAEKPAKKQAPKKQTAAKKTEKPEQKTEIFIEYNEHQLLESDIVAQVKEEFRKKGHRVASIKTLQVYIKPEDAKAYYVINDGKDKGEVKLF